MMERSALPGYRRARRRRVELPRKSGGNSATGPSRPRFIVGAGLAPFAQGTRPAGLNGAGRRVGDARGVAYPAGLQDLVTLYEAAGHALARLLPAHVAASAGAVVSLDLVAIAISALVPVYKRDSASGELRRASAAELAKVKLTRGASALLITRSDAESAAEKLVAQYVGTKPGVPAPSAEGRRKHP